MSFSSEAKNELCRLSPRPCCRRAECYGLLLFGRGFSPAGVSLATANRGVARRAAQFAAEVTGAVMEVLPPRPRRHGPGVYTARAADPTQAGRVLAALGHTGREVSLRINLANLENECCRRAFLRGAFLACGTAADPGREYHLEYSVPHRNLANDLFGLMRDILGLDPEPRVSRRGGAYVVYLKGAQRVADFLTYLGAPDAAMRLLQVRMLKDLRNTVNRQTNFETANLGKTASAAAGEVLAIQKIKSAGGFSLLPRELRALAALRLHHPELSLRELGQRLSPPLSRSGVHHRLRRILEIAERVPGGANLKRS